MVSYIRWYKGYLKIQLIGYSPERFLNICKNKNIIVWDIKSKEQQYEMCILLKDFKKLKPLCKKTGTRIKIIDKIGFPFYVNQLKYRKAFLTGFLLSLLILYLTSFHIWSIEIKGNQKLTSDVICTYLNNQTIHLGTHKNQLNCKKLAAEMRKEFEEIIWVSVSIDGTKLSIELKENADAKVLNKENISGDLIAKYDCTITRIITRNGIPMVQIGDEVKKGDILVSGSIPVLNDNKEIVSTKYVKADADIYGEMRINYQDKINRSYKTKQYKKEYLYWKIGPWVKKIKDKKDKEIFIENKYMNIGKIKEYDLINDSYSETERNDILIYNYDKFCSKLKEENVIILDSHFIISHYNDYSIGVSNLLIEQQIN